MRAVVNVSIGEKFAANHDRLENSMRALGENFIGWRTLPPGSPSHEETPFAFKAFALQAAATQGADVLLWADSSIVPVHPLTPLWDLIESQGYWFSENFPHGSTVGPYTNGQWTSDASLALLEVTREQSFRFPHVIGTAFGLDLRRSIARQFLEEYLRLAKDGTAFRGELSNRDLSQSFDRRVLGHRHDQTAASVLAWRLGMRLTKPPIWIVDGLPAASDTVLEIRRHPNLTPCQISDIVQSVLPFTMMDEERVTCLVRETERVVQKEIPGVIVECGVWRGGGMMAIAKALLLLGVPDMELLLFDTYSGMPTPDPVDVDLHGRAAMDPSSGSYDPIGCAVSLEDVQSAMNSTGYDPIRLHYYKGRVEETLPAHAPAGIALLHLDTDWYSSTRQELECLFPQVAVGGCVVVDDFGHWQGARKATDEYLEQHAPHLKLERLGYTAAIIRKTA